MLDSKIRPIIDPSLNKAGQILARSGVTANQITIAGFLLGCVAFFGFAAQYYGIALFFILLNRLSDGLDGAVARGHNALLAAENTEQKSAQKPATNKEDFGGFLDIICDFLFYSGCVFFFALGRPDMSIYAAFLLFSFFGSGTTFLTFAVISAKRGENHDRQGKKSFYYLEGLAEGFETILYLILICIFPDHFAVLSMIFAGLCWLTAIGRVTAAMKTFR